MVAPLFGHTQQTNWLSQENPVRPNTFFWLLVVVFKHGLTANLSACHDNVSALNCYLIVIARNQIVVPLRQFFSF